MTKKEKKVALECTVTVVTKEAGRKAKHGPLERRIEDDIQSYFCEYIKTLVSRIAGTESYEWKRLNKRKIELVRRENV